MIVDLLLVNFCLYCSIRGIWRGTVNEAFSIVGIFIGLIVASAYYADVAQFICNWIINKQIGFMFAYLVSFFIIYLIINCLGTILSYLFHITISGWGSRISGGVVGSFKGLLFVSVLLIPLVTFSPKDSNYIKNSTLFYFETSVSEQILPVISKEMRRNYSIKIRNYKKTWRLNNKSSS